MLKSMSILTARNVILPFVWAMLLILPILLTRLAREEPGLYAKSASREGGLQEYVEAMGEFN